MSEPTTAGRSRSGRRYLLTAAAAVIVIAGLRAAGSLILPVLLAGFLAILAEPLLRGLRKLRIGVPIAVLVTVLAVVAVIVVFSLLVSAAMAEVGAGVPNLLNELQRQAYIARDQLREWSLGDYIDMNRVDPVSAVEFLNSTFGGVVRRTVLGVATLLSYTTLVLLALIFMLAESAGLSDKLQLVLKDFGTNPTHLLQIRREVQHYLGIKTAISLATGAAIFGATWYVGLDFPLFWGLLAFVLNYIPTLGSIIAGIPAVVLALLQGGLGLAGLVALIYVATNIILGNLIEPRVMGQRFRLSTLVVFLSVLFWGFVWGPVGMLLSVPLTRSIVIVLGHTAELQWVTVLLGRKPPVPVVSEESS
jgi:predicted PurR-regulated permease PerM